MNKRAYKQNPLPIPLSGIPKRLIANFEEVVNIKDMKCPICLNLIWNPIDCADCGKCFCDYCLNEWLSQKFSCPMCNSKHFKFSGSKALKSFFENIKIKCINENCKEEPYYQNYIEHLRQCDFKLYHCTNEGCNYEDILSNIQEHETECIYRVVSCKYCFEKIRQKDFLGHILSECKQEIECKYCHEKMTRGDFNKIHC